MSIIAIEIGGTKQQIAVGETDGTILELRSVKLGSGTNPQNIISWLDGNIADFRKSYPISAISVGYGGPVDLESGTVICSMQVDGWRDIRLRDHFSEKFSLPCCLLNDSDCGGLGELRCGAGRGSRKLFYTNIGTGIGGSILIDGRLYTGSGRGSGEIGHTWTLDYRTGKLDELENVCSGPAVERALNTKGYVPRDSSLYALLENGSMLCCADLGRAAEQGDAFACRELDNIADSFACAVSAAVSLLAPDCVVIGGGLANMGETLIGRIRDRLSFYSYKAFNGYYTVKKSELLDSAVIVGALAAAENITG